MNPPQQGDEADDAAMTAQLESNSIPPGERSDTTPIDSTHAEGGNDDTSATPLQMPSLTCTPSASFYEERFQSAYVEDCADINDFLKQLYFWRALMKESGKDIQDSSLIELILARLPSEYNEPRAFYASMLHSYAFCGKVTLGEVDRGLRFFGNLLQEKTPTTENERKALGEVRAKASSQPLNVEFLEHGLKFTHLGDCLSVEDYLGRMYFWRRSFKGRGKNVGNSAFLGAMIKDLTVHYRNIGAHYLMLRCTPAFNDQRLEDFAGRLLALEEEIHSFDRDRTPNLIEVILGDLRYRWRSVNAVEMDWKLKSYFVLTAVSFALNIIMLTPATKPFHEGIQLAILVLWLSYSKASPLHRLEAEFEGAGKSRSSRGQVRTIVLSVELEVSYGGGGRAYYVTAKTLGFNLTESGNRGAAYVDSICFVLRLFIFFFILL